MELVVEEVAGEFDGEGPAHPRERQALNESKKRLEELHEAARTHTGPLELPGPEEEELDRLREAIRRQGERFE